MDLRQMQDVFARALTDSRLPPPDGLGTARGGSDAMRFAVYRNNVAVGLSRALANRFPVVEKLVGADFFGFMARSYIAGTKPSSPVIIGYGDSFPDFVAGFGPAEGLPYLADVARLEAAWTRAYHATDAVALDVRSLAGISPGDLPNTRFQRHPGTALVQSPFPAGSIWQAHQSDPIAPVTARGSERVLVTRPAFDVRVHVLPPADGPFAAMLLAGEALGAAARASTDPAFDFGTALVGLVSTGAFMQFIPDHGGHSE